MYSTCTINPAENEENVQLLKNIKFFIENFERICQGSWVVIL
ncbi:MAG: hypothetical protein ACLR23_04870 [Clostridia bacterium]